MIKDHLLLGVGPGNYPVVSPPYLGGQILDAHNIFLTILSELGFFAFLLFLIILIISGYRALKYEKRKNFPIFLSILGVITQNMATSSITRSAALMAILFFLIALISPNQSAESEISESNAKIGNRKLFLNLGVIIGVIVYLLMINKHGKFGILLFPLSLSLGFSLSYIFSNLDNLSNRWERKNTNFLFFNLAISLFAPFILLSFSYSSSLSYIYSINGVNSVNMGNYSEGLTMFQKGISYQNENKFNHLMLGITYQKLGMANNSTYIMRDIKQFLPWDTLVLTSLFSANPTNDTIYKKLGKIEDNGYRDLILSYYNYRSGKKKESEKLLTKLIMRNPMISNSIFMMRLIADDKNFVEKLTDKIDVKKLKNDISSPLYYADFLIILGKYEDALKIYDKFNDKYMVKLVNVLKSKKNLSDFFKDRLISSKNEVKQLKFKLLTLFYGLEAKTNNCCESSLLKEIGNKYENYSYLFVYELLKNEKYLDYYRKEWSIMRSLYPTPVHFTYLTRPMRRCRVLYDELMPIFFWKMEKNYMYASMRFPVEFFLIDNDRKKLSTYIKIWNNLINLTKR
jgi:hypothetical protein